MSKVTTKLQITLPKAIADQYGIRPGDELEWIPAGDSIRVGLTKHKMRNRHQMSAREKLAVFDDNTRWLDELQAEQLKSAKTTPITREKRGWTREELYEERGLSRRH